MYKTNQLIQLYNMNLEYPIQNLSLESHTNYLINQQMNYFIKEFKDDFSKLFVIDYKDDLLSLICYRIIKNLQEVSPFKFNIAIYGRTFRTKKLLVKKEKRISNWKLNKLIKNNQVVIISPINPVYKVVNTGIEFNNFNCPIWKPLNRFIPDQLKTAQVFFNIGYLPKDRIQLDKNLEIKEFNKLCNRTNNLFEIPNNIKYNKDITLIKLTGNNNIDQELLNRIEDVDGLIFYFYESEFCPMLYSDFSIYIKNKVNIPFENNTNEYDIPIELIKRGCYPNFIGDWSIDEKKKFKQEDK